MAHRNRGPVDDLLARGAAERNSAESVARDADLVILCVTGTPQIEQLVYGENGLLSAVREGLIIADCCARGRRRLGPSAEAHQQLHCDLSAIRNAGKDLRYYTNMTELLPVTSFLAETAHQITVMADNLGYGERHLPRLIDVLMKINGLSQQSLR